MVDCISKPLLTASFFTNAKQSRLDLKEVPVKIKDVTFASTHRRRQSLRSGAKSRCARFTEREYVFFFFFLVKNRTMQTKHPTSNVHDRKWCLENLECNTFLHFLTVSADYLLARVWQFRRRIFSFLLPSFAAFLPATSPPGPPRDTFDETSFPTDRPPLALRE